MLRFLLVCCSLLFLCKPNLGRSQATTCQKLRFAEVGWTDVAVTTAIARKVFHDLGYHTELTHLSVPVTFRAMQAGDIDLFLGYWKPSMDADIKPYLEAGDIELGPTILKEAKYTLAVPAYVAAEGVQNFRDLAPYKERFDGKIYGLEPGNDGNRLLHSILKSQDFGLKAWSLVESSEQGMLAEVMQAHLQKQWIVFLAWAPHPMNRKLDLVYLKGGDAYFGKNLGAAEVLMTSRRGFLNSCPELSPVLDRIKFTIEEVNELMEAVIDQQKTPDEAAEAWLTSHPDRWLDMRGSPSKEVYPSEEKTVWPYRLNLGRWLSDHGGPLFEPWIGPLRSLSKGINQSVNQLIQASMVMSPLVLIVGLSLASWLLTRRWGLALSTGIGVGLIFSLGYGKEAIETLVLVGLASALSLALGLPLGILAAKYRPAYQVLRPILDMMQTLPTFVYLIPALMLFGLGFSPGLLATLVFVLPVPIRMSYLGLSSVPRSLRELGPAFGASPWQSLWKIELPYAWPTIRTGISQSLLLGLSMVVISALVGADGLGKPVVQALNTVDIGMGLEAGLAIVILAMLVDRTVQPQKSETWS